MWFLLSGLVRDYIRLPDIRTSVVDQTPGNVHDVPPSTKKPTKSVATPAAKRTTTPQPSLAYVVARLDRVLRRAIETAIAPYELTVTQYTVLSALARQPGLSSAQLARRAYVSPQSMNEMLLVLEERGLVKRKPHPDRRRVLNSQLSAKGQRLVVHCDRGVAAVETTMTGTMKSTERDALRTLMVLAVRNLGGGFPERPLEVAT
jgi:DNA-binding MarR family transcriptional regulator